ncbi:hypothetical protein A9G44_12950 [Gilliamella sp. Occ4-3]|nr:hypothetical protein A9G44_12950 [Gilliamella apicola]
MRYYLRHLVCQTFAINFFQFHHSQKQTQFLFLSPKSFCVAKLCLSAGLSLRSRFKPLSLLSRYSLVFAPLLLLPCSFDTQALSAQTTKAIAGSAPYLTFDGGQTKATNTDTFLAIELPDGRRITQSTNTSSFTNPIRLPSGNFTFNDIHMVIPSGATSTSLSSLISQGKWGDDDGDGQGVGGVTASGSISLAIKDRNGTAVNRSDTLSLCNAPYKVTLDSTGGTLETRYGMPKTSRFYAGAANYYITLSSQPVICSVRPNLDRGTGNWAGPSNIWRPTKGFLVQSTNPSSYGLNFPTTGANGLYFDLDIAGIDASQLRWTVNTSGNLNATVAWRLPNQGTNEDGWITDKSQYVTRVTLTGPKADSSQINSSSPSPLTRPFLPQTFELVGRDKSGNVVKYGFVLQKWFVNRGNYTDTPSGQTTWCSSLGYHLSRIRDLTNAKCGVQANDRFPCVDGIDGATPSSGTMYYQRHIGAGFFTEWGNMGRYADAGFLLFTGYWTSDAIYDTYFDVNSNNGYVYRYRGGEHPAVCTTP